MIGILFVCIREISINRKLSRNAISDRHAIISGGQGRVGIEAVAAHVGFSGLQTVSEHIEKLRAVGTIWQIIPFAVDFDLEIKRLTIREALRAIIF